MNVSAEDGWEKIVGLMSDEKQSKQLGLQENEEKVERKLPKTARIATIQPIL